MASISGPTGQSGTLGGSGQQNRAAITVGGHAAGQPTRSARLLELAGHHRASLDKYGPRGRCPLYRRDDHSPACYCAQPARFFCVANDYCHRHCLGCLSCTSLEENSIKHRIDHDNTGASANAPHQRQLVDAVEREPSKRWRDADFATLGIHASTARRQFQKRFGMTFVAYARARRLGVASVAPQRRLPRLQPIEEVWMKTRSAMRAQ